MGEAVLRVRAHLQALARENWGELEEQHARNLSWLRGELAQVSRSLEIAARFDHKRPAQAAPFPSGDDVLEAGGRASKKQKLRDGEGGADAALGPSSADEPTSAAIPAASASDDTRSRQEEHRVSKRTSVRTRLSTQHKPEEPSRKSRKRSRPQEQHETQAQMRDPTKLKVVELRSELRERGLRTSGLKAVLLDRLLDAMEEEHSDDSGNADSGKSTHADSTAVSTASTLKRAPQEETDALAISGSATEAARSTEGVGTSTARSVDDSIVRESFGSPRSVQNSHEDRSSSPGATFCTSKQSEVAESSSAQKAPQEKHRTVALSTSSDKNDTIQQDSGLDHRVGTVLQKTTADVRGEAIPVAIDNDTQNAAAAEPVTRSDQAQAIDSKRTKGMKTSASSSADADAELESVESTHSRREKTVIDLTRSWEELQAPTKSVKNSFNFRGDAVAGEMDKADAPMEAKTRKSMLTRGTDATSSSHPWKRKSILRKATSLAPRNRRPLRKVSFAEKGKVDIIVEASQPETTHPDSSPEQTVAPVTPSVVGDASDELGRMRASSLPKAAGSSSLQAVTTPEASLSSSSTGTKEKPAAKASSLENVEMTEGERRRKEFQESVAREADRLRKAAKLSAKKRYEQSKASDAFWRKREQLKKVQSSAGSSSDTAILDQATTPTSIASDAWMTEAVPSALAPSSLTRAVSSDASSTTSADQRKVRTGLDTTGRAETSRKVVAVSSPPPPTPPPMEEPAHKSTVKGVPAPVSVLPPATEKKSTTTASAHTSGRKEAKESEAAWMHSNADQDAPLVEKSASKPIISVASAPSDRERSQTAATHDLAANPVAQAPKKPRAESVSSSMPSAADSSVEVDSKTDNSESTDGARRPIANLISGLHSFTTLLEKDTKSNRNSNGGGRSAPVVNALKLAEKSRLQEEKKQLEKEKRKAALKRKIDEQKKTAALKEKEERDTRAKREEERLNERKKREAELAKRRQQKIQEMHAGLEKKRAQQAAERRTARLGVSSKPVGTTTASASSSHHSKHHGLANASKALKASTNPASKLTVKPASQASKPVAQKAVAQTPALQTQPQKPTSKFAQQKPAPKLVSKSTTGPTSTKPRLAPKTQPSEVVNYEMSDNGESGGDDSDSEGEKHGSKNIPRWAQKEHLNKTLRAQFGKNAVDPSPSIFVDFVDTCDLEAIFETADVRKKKRFQRRTSSGNWLADRPTARDKALYEHEMGYHR